MLSSGRPSGSPLHYLKTCPMKCRGDPGGRPSSANVYRFAKPYKLLLAFSFQVSILFVIFFIPLFLVLIPFIIKFVVSGVATDAYSWGVDDGQEFTFVFVFVGLGVLIAYGTIFRVVVAGEDFGGRLATDTAGDERGQVSCHDVDRKRVAIFVFFHYAFTFAYDSEGKVGSGAKVVIMGEFQPGLENFTQFKIHVVLLRG